MIAILGWILLAYLALVALMLGALAVLSVVGRPRLRDLERDIRNGDAEFTGYPWSMWS